MKKKILYGMMAFLAFAFMSGSLTSCTDDDDKKLGDVVKPDDNKPDEDNFEDLIKPDPNDPALTGDHDPELIGTWIHDGKEDEHSWDKYVFLANGRFKYQGYGYDDVPYWETGYWATDDGELYICCTNTNYEYLGSSWSICYWFDDDENLIIPDILYVRQ